MERLKMMKEQLMSAIQGELGNLSQADTKELGEAIDMIKDLSEAIYYCTVTEAMQGNEKHSSSYRDMDKDKGRMYYDGNGSRGYDNWNNRYYPVESYRDYNEGRSPMTRKTYMERKMHGGDKNTQMRELDKYMHELSQDLAEMIEGASPEEKQMLQQKLNTLATKVV